MKLLLFTFLGFFGSHATAIAFSYTITKSHYLFSTYFEMDGKQQYEGRVIKNHLNLREIYDLYDPSGQYSAQGVCQILSLGSIFPWGKDIDVYDTEGQRIGCIDGQLLTMTAAKYSFYDQHGECIGNAYLDWNSSSFTIMAANERTIARLKRQFILDDTDAWEVVLYDPGMLDPRILKIFSAFAIDSQNYFKMDR